MYVWFYVEPCLQVCGWVVGFLSLISMFEFHRRQLLDVIDGAVVKCLKTLPRLTQSLEAVGGRDSTKSHVIVIEGVSVLSLFKVPITPEYALFSRNYN